MTRLLTLLFFTLIVLVVPLLSYGIIPLDSDEEGVGWLYLNSNTLYVGIDFVRVDRSFHPRVKKINLNGQTLAKVDFSTLAVSAFGVLIDEARFLIKLSHNLYFLNSNDLTIRKTVPLNPPNFYDPGNYGAYDEKNHIFWFSLYSTQYNGVGFIEGYNVTSESFLDSHFSCVGLGICSMSSLPLIFDPTSYTITFLSKESSGDNYLQTVDLNSLLRIFVSPTPLTSFPPPSVDSKHGFFHIAGDIGGSYVLYKYSLKNLLPFQSLSLPVPIGFLLYDEPHDWLFLGTSSNFAWQTSLIIVEEDDFEVIARYPIDGTSRLTSAVIDFSNNIIYMGTIGKFIVSLDFNDLVKLKGK